MNWSPSVPHQKLRGFCVELRDFGCLKGAVLWWNRCVELRGSVGELRGILKLEKGVKFESITSGKWREMMTFLTRFFAANFFEFLWSFLFSWFLARRFDRISWRSSISRIIDALSPKTCIILKNASIIKTWSNEADRVRKNRRLRQESAPGRAGPAANSGKPGSGLKIAGLRQYEPKLAEPGADPLSDVLKLKWKKSKGLKINDFVHSKCWKLLYNLKKVKNLPSVFSNLRANFLLSSGSSPASAWSKTWIWLVDVTMVSGHCPQIRLRLISSVLSEYPTSIMFRYNFWQNNDFGMSQRKK